MTSTSSSGRPDVEVVAFTATQIPGIADRRYPPELAGPRTATGSRSVPRRSSRRSSGRARRRGRVRLQRRQPRDRDARGIARRSRPAPTSAARARADDARAEGRSWRSARPGPGPARARRPAISPRCSPSGADAGRHPASDALRRPGRAARPAISRPTRTSSASRRRSRSARSTSRISTPGGRLRRRRLRGDPARGRDGGRRHPVGRRQQRLPLLSPGPEHRRRRSASAG